MKKKGVEPVLTEEQIEELRGALGAEKDSLEEELASYGKNSGKEWQGSSTSVGEEPDSTDAADNIEELVTNVPLVGELDKRRREIESALERMDAGKYGVCEVCKTAIDFDRLEANAAARTCVKHAQ